MEQNDILLLALYWFAQLGLLFVQVFRFNFLFSVASIIISMAMSNVPGVNVFFNYAGWFVGFAQIIAGFIITMFGKKSANRSHLG